MFETKNLSMMTNSFLGIAKAWMIRSRAFCSELFWKNFFRVANKQVMVAS